MDDFSFYKDSSLSLDFFITSLYSFRSLAYRQTGGSLKTCIPEWVAVLLATGFFFISVAVAYSSGYWILAAAMLGLYAVGGIWALPDTTPYPFTTRHSDHWVYADWSQANKGCIVM